MIVTDKQIEMVRNFLGGVPVYRAGKYNGIYALIDGQATRVAYIGVTGSIVLDIPSCNKAVAGRTA